MNPLTRSLACSLTTLSSPFSLPLLLRFPETDVCLHLRAGRHSPLPSVFRGHGHCLIPHALVYHHSEAKTVSPSHSCACSCSVSSSPSDFATTHVVALASLALTLASWHPSSHRLPVSSHTISDQEGMAVMKDMGTPPRDPSSHPPRFPLVGRLEWVLPCSASGGRQAHREARSSAEGTCAGRPVRLLCQEGGSVPSLGSIPVPSPPIPVPPSMQPSTFLPPLSSCLRRAWPSAQPATGQALLRTVTNCTG